MPSWSAAARTVSSLPRPSPEPAVRCSCSRPPTPSAADSEATSSAVRSATGAPPSCPSPSHRQRSSTSTWRPTVCAGATRTFPSPSRSMTAAWAHRCEISMPRLSFSASMARAIADSSHRSSSAGTTSPQRSNSPSPTCLAILSCSPGTDSQGSDRPDSSSNASRPRRPRACSPVAPHTASSRWSHRSPQHSPPCSPRARMRSGGLSSRVARPGSPRRSPPSSKPRVARSG